jgi:uncharacterized membrane protein
MSRISIIFGILLILVGGAGYGMSDQATWIALIPSLIGLALVACAVLDLLSEVAGTILGLLIALAGIGGTFMNVLDLGSLFVGTAAHPAIVVTSTITFILLIAYAVIAIRSLRTPSRTHRHPAGAV